MGWTLIIAMVLTMTKTHTISLIYSLHDYQILVHIDAYTFEFIDDIDSYIDINTSCTTILALARSQLHHCCAK
jgi:hypothetical protein